MSQTPVIKLKELLFDKESQEIDTLAARVDELLARTGTDDRLRASVARVLEGAIRDAEADRHRELAAALAPVVVRTVRTEIVSPDTQDKIAGSLYTKIGEMVRRYVASAMRDLLEGINRRLESGLTGNRFMLRLRSLFTGRSMAELALASAERLRVEEVYLIRRGSGELVRHWYASPDVGVPQGGNRDTLISGFLTAITAFAEEAFEAEKSSLRALDLDAHRVFLRGSPTHLVAAKCLGAAPGDIEALLDAEMIRLLEEQGQVEAMATEAAGGSEPSDADLGRAYDRILSDFAMRFEDGAQARHSQGSTGRSQFGTVKTLAVLVALPFLAYFGWSTWLGYRASVLQAGADEIVDRLTALRGYPVGVRVEAGGQVIRVHGLTPNEAVRADLLRELGKLASGVVVKDFLASVPQADPGRAIRAAAVQGAVFRAEQSLGRLAADLDRLMPGGERGPEVTVVQQSLRERLARSRAELAGKKAEDLAALDDAGIGQKLAPILAGLAEGELALAKLGGVTNAAPSPPAAADRRDGVAGIDVVAATADRLSRLLLAYDVSQRAAAERARATAELTTQLAALGEKLEALTRPTARQRLESFIKSNAVFFANATDFRDPTGTSEVLDRLSRLIQETPDVLVRIVGYTDDLGGQQSQRNLGLSQQRADMILEELVRRGVPRSRLVAVGRATNQDLAPRSAAGMTPASRRVEFEIGFIGEDSIKP